MPSPLAHTDNPDCGRLPEAVLITTQDQITSPPMTLMSIVMQTTVPRTALYSITRLEATCSWNGMA